MAYSKSFKTLDGTSLTVTVGGVSVSNDLPLASNPFETQEQADTDMFMPVRTQSGYLRIQSMDASTWRAFIPSGVTSEPVTLTQGGTTLWRGYVQTGTYGMRFPATFDTIELPLVCPLGALDSLDYDVAPTDQQGNHVDMVTFGQLLAHIFEKLNLGNNQLHYYFNVGSGSTASVSAWLSCRVIWRNLLTTDGSTLKQRFSCLGLLEEICKFFGWSCRAKGDGIYFTSAADSSMRSSFICYDDTDDLANGSYTSVSMDSLTLANSHFASAAHTEQYVPGAKTVTVRSELSPYSILVEVPYDKLYNEKKYGNVSQGWHHKVLHDRYNCYVLFDSSDGNSSWSYSDTEVSLWARVIHSDTDKQNEVFGRLYIYDEEIEQNKTRYKWNIAFECFHGYKYSYTPSVNSWPLFAMESQAAYIIGSGVLYINSDRCDLDVYGIPLGTLSAVCILRIGTTASNYKYWNGSAWTSTASTFTMSYNSNGIKDVQAAGMTAEYDGYGIPVTSVMAGKVYFAVLNVLPLNIVVDMWNGYFPLMGLKVGFIREGEDEDMNDASYTHSGGQFPSVINVDTIFSTDKKKSVNSKTIRCWLGYGIVYDGLGNIVDTITYSSGFLLKPEEHVAEVIGTFESSNHRVLTLDLWTSEIGNVGPDFKVMLGQQTFCPVAVGHRWRDNITTLTLISI